MIRRRWVGQVSSGTGPSPRSAPGGCSERRRARSATGEAARQKCTSPAVSNTILAERGLQFVFGNDAPHLAGELAGQRPSAAGAAFGAGVSGIGGSNSAAGVFVGHHEWSGLTKDFCLAYTSSGARSMNRSTHGTSTTRRRSSVDSLFTGTPHDRRDGRGRRFRVRVAVERVATVNGYCGTGSDPDHSECVASGDQRFFRVSPARALGELVQQGRPCGEMPNRWVDPFPHGLPANRTPPLRRIRLTDNYCVSGAAGWIRIRCGIRRRPPGSCDAVWWLLPPRRVTLSQRTRFPVRAARAGIGRARVASHTVVFGTTPPRLSGHDHINCMSAAAHD